MPRSRQLRRRDTSQSTGDEEAVLAERMSRFSFKEYSSDTLWESYLGQFELVCRVKGLGGAGCLADAARRDLLLASVGAEHLTSITDYLYPRAIEECTFEEIKAAASRLFRPSGTIFAARFEFERAERLADVPKFGEPITNITVTVGREAVLSCIVEDLGAFKVAWLRVDTQTILTIHTHVITKNHRIGVSHSDHRTWYLHIKEIREADRGWYMCQINTDPMKSQMGFLEVVVPPNILDAGTSTDMVVREGDSVSFKCAASGSPPPVYSWKREAGLPISLGGKTVTNVIEGPSFNMSRVNRLHMGAYLCIASNGVPPTVSKRISLIVHFPPMIQIQNQLVGAMEGDDVTLECDTEAFPKSINYWTTTHGEVLPKGTKYQPEFNETSYKVKMRLIIRNITLSDYGMYSCVSKNSLGETDGSIKVYHIPRPTTTTAATTVTTTTTTKPTTTEQTTRAPRKKYLDYETVDLRKNFQDNELSIIPGHREQPARAGSIKPGSLHEGKMEKSSYAGGAITLIPCHLLVVATLSLFF